MAASGWRPGNPKDAEREKARQNAILWMQEAAKKASTEAVTRKAAATVASKASDLTPKQSPDPT